MTAQELNIKIEEGAKSHGSKNAFLASTEYRTLYKQFKSTPVIKSQTKVEIVKVDHLGNGYFIKIGKNTYAAQLGDSVGVAAGPMMFNSIESAQAFCNKKNYGY